MNNKGFTGLEMFVVIAVFSAVYLIGMVNVSYAFDTNYEEEAYEDVIGLIEMQSELYASLNEELFEETDTIYIYVSDLVDNNLISANESGNVIDPTNENNSLNNLKIKVVLTDGEYKSSLVEI